ncbi:MAG: molybdate ABC transporter substrate-binding protein [Ktedonobacteraceae bacterium]
MLKARFHVVRALFLPIIACLLFAACGSTAGSGSAATTTPKAVTLNVFAAASLTESFKEIATKFQAGHSGVTVRYNFGGSQLLEQQIASGAPSDVFASADQTNMKKAADAGLVGTSQPFVKNKLVVIIPANNPGKINSLKDLANKGVKIDIEASAVPAGKYTREILGKMAKSPEYGASYESAVKANFVSQEDNVKAVVTKVQLGEADAGFVYLTDVTKNVSSQVKEIIIPDNFNVIAEYPIATTKNSAHASDAQAFVQYVLSSDGQAILQKYGFIAASSGS